MNVTMANAQHDANNYSTTKLLKNLKAIEMLAKVLPKVYMVGGATRDMVRFHLGENDALHELEDIDLEVFGVTYEQLIDVLHNKLQLKTDTVGASFGVVKLKDYDIDISLPRKETKTGSGHKEFAINVEPNLSVKEAMERRDFTINAIYWDVVTGELVDHFGGISDLKAKQLMCVSDKFGEDPLRVLRAMQFIARFDLKPTDSLVATCLELSDQFCTLPKERIMGEFDKMLLKARNIKAGLNFLIASGWIRHFPELNDLRGVPQDPVWHPEGDVFIHTGHCLSHVNRPRSWGPTFLTMANRAPTDEETLIVAYAVLCHDFGKPACTMTDENGRIRSPGHEAEGCAPAAKFMSRLTDRKDLINQVVNLVKTHMRLLDIGSAKSETGLKRLCNLVGRLDLLVSVCICDQLGRPPLTMTPEFSAALDWIIPAAKRLRIASEKPKPIIMGRHLISVFNMTPSDEFKVILNAAFEAQLDGLFNDLDTGLAYVKEHLLSGDKPAQ